MLVANNILNSRERALAKQQSRDDDRVRLESGIISGADLRHENGLASRLPMHRYKISAIGGRSISS